MSRIAKKKLTLEDVLVPKDEIPYEVPENWCWIKLGGLVNEVKNGTTIKQNKDEIGPKVTRIESVQNNKIDFNRIGYITEEGKIKESDWYEAGDIALSHINSIEHVGKTALIEEDYLPLVHGMNLLRIRLKKELINPKYFAIYTQGYDFKSEVVDRVNRAVNQVSLNQKRLNEIPIAVPPLAEQERIVNRIESLFDKVDKAAGLVDEARDGFEKRRAAILERAFSGELTKKWREENGIGDVYKTITDELIHREEIYKGLKKKDKPNFMNYNMNNLSIDEELPNGWVKCEIGLLCDCIVPGRDKPKSFTGKTLWITIPNLVDDYVGVGYSDLSLSEDEIETVKAKVIPNDSVVMSCVGRFGISSVVKDECVINQQLHAFLPSNLILPKYLMYHIRILRGYMEQTATSTTVAYLNKNNCNSLPINLPSIEEQREIIKILDTVLSKENQSDYLTDISEVIDATKKSIIAKAFRGELGSNNLDEESSIELLKELVK